MFGCVSNSDMFRAISNSGAVQAIPISRSIKNLILMMYRLINADIIYLKLN